MYYFRNLFYKYILGPRAIKYLPSQITVDGQRFVRTTRGQMLFNNGLKFLRSGLSTLSNSLPNIVQQNVPVTDSQKNNASNKPKQQEEEEEEEIGSEKEESEDKKSKTSNEKDDDDYTYEYSEEIIYE